MEYLPYIVCGLLPAIVLIFIGIRAFRGRTEIRGSNLILPILGGVVIAVPAYFMQVQLHAFSDVDYSNWGYVFLTAFIYVALIEEISKALVLWMSNRWMTLDEGMDVLLVSLAIAMGFAGVENTLYSFEKGWEIALFRSLTAVPAHACFAIMMAYFPAVNFGNRTSLKPYLYGILPAWLFHGAYDVFIVQDISEVLLVGSLVVLLVIFILSYKVYLRISSK